MFPLSWAYWTLQRDNLYRETQRLSQLATLRSLDLERDMAEVVMLGS